MFVVGKPPRHRRVSSDRQALNLHGLRAVIVVDHLHSHAAVCVCEGRHIERHTTRCDTNPCSARLDKATVLRESPQSLAHFHCVAVDQDERTVGRRVVRTDPVQSGAHVRYRKQLLDVVGPSQPLTTAAVVVPSESVCAIQVCPTNRRLEPIYVSDRGITLRFAYHSVSQTLPVVSNGVLGGLE